jgi:hypothetical protein
MAVARNPVCLSAFRSNRRASGLTRAEAIQRPTTLPYDHWDGVVASLHACVGLIVWITYCSQTGMPPMGTMGTTVARSCLPS